jgi:ribosomal protein S1
MKLIIESLSNSIDYDHRINFKQIYLPDIQYFYELNEGSNLTGRVLNVTPMGAFIDCGIAGGINAYLSAKECEKHNISVNNNVLVRIVSINREMQRFRVSLLKVFNTNVKFT